MQKDDLKCTTSTNEIVFSICRETAQNLTTEILRAFVDKIVVFKNPPRGTTTSDGKFIQHEIAVSLCCGLKVFWSV